MKKIDEVPQDKVTPLRLAQRAGNGQSKMSLVVCYIYYGLRVS